MFNEIVVEEVSNKNVQSVPTENVTWCHHCHHCHSCHHCHHCHR